MHQITLWRRLLAEFIGTALLVTAVVGSGIMATTLSPNDVGLQLLENSVATAFALGALILMFGPVSGAHFNPVVSAADWFLGRRARTGHVLHTMDDTFALLTSVEQRQARSAVIVGAGYIGLEMSEALTGRGLQATLLEQLDQVMPTIDPELADPLAAHLRERGVSVHTGTKVQAIGTAGRHLGVDTDAGRFIAASRR